jgi:hypothetical protein
MSQASSASLDAGSTSRLTSIEATCQDGPLGISLKKLALEPAATNSDDAEVPGQVPWAAVLMRKTKAILDADLQPGDRLVKVNDQHVHDMEDYKQLLQIMRTTRPIALTFTRISRSSSEHSAGVNVVVPSSTSASTPVRSTSPQRTRDRLSRFAQVLNARVIDMDRLRAMGLDGIPGEDGTRALAWRLLLGLLPPERAQWEEALAQKREL